MSHAYYWPNCDVGDRAVISRLEHELGIAGHEADCSVCQGRKRIERGECHGDLGNGDVWRSFECPHDI